MWRKLRKKPEKVKPQKILKLKMKTITLPSSKKMRPNNIPHTLHTKLSVRLKALAAAAAGKVQAGAQVQAAALAREAAAELAAAVAADTAQVLVWAWATASPALRQCGPRLCAVLRRCTRKPSGGRMLRA